jgi:hypothetical protein
MSYEFYKIIHLLGLMSLFFGFATILILAMTDQLRSARARMIGFLTHGLGLFLIIVSGFGMAARLGYFNNLPHWIYAKIGIWVVAGVIISLLRRKPGLAFFNLILVLALGTTAAWLAVTKPF